jgi:lipoic acid synthetase
MMGNPSENLNLSSPGRFPEWLKRPLAFSGKQKTIEKHVHCEGLHTVCVEAKCPNRSECYSNGTATFLIMGNTCTRNCGFCGVNHGIPAKLDLQEPARISSAVKKLSIKHIVITSVTRDDLEDGGAAFFADTIKTIREDNPGTKIEVLVPDFQGCSEAIGRVISAAPDIFNHNVETVPSFYDKIRPQAIYKRSLAVLAQAAQSGIVTKSGIMVGLGEDESEVLGVMKDIYLTGCSILTIGQYLRPSKEQVQVKSFVSPEQFDYYKREGEKIGFAYVFAGPFVRSSYRASEVTFKAGVKCSQ